jgi:hypothetical protein
MAKRKEQQRKRKHYAFSPGKMKWLAEVGGQAKKLVTPQALSAVGLGGGVGAALGLHDVAAANSQRKQLELSDLPKNMQDVLNNPLVKQLLAQQQLQQAQTIPAPTGYALPKIGPMFKRTRSIMGSARNLAKKRVSLGTVAAIGGGAIAAKKLAVDPVVDDWATRRLQHNMIDQ